ncbi:arylesterase [Pseudomonas asuensis]|uniref:Esterase TesA n=1 Tax=Pseudomonas asuensis TaxID=1825787 RepID=A0ABQ2H1X9_9PSED|nr:arylesterase [Pseudomonas asuensis]GGM24043.1 esterase TesA [Pseudomonas asuensis]
MRKWLSGGCLALLLVAQQAAAQTLLIVGDSISAGLGIEMGQGWAALLEKRLGEQGDSYKVINASISGDTSAGGLSRLPLLLNEHKPDVVIIELGGNDGLRGQPPAQLQQNLALMVDQSKQAGASVLLLGMRLPPNYGVRYTERFAAVYSNVADEKKVALVPFFLEGVGGIAQYMQPDGIHPNVAAQPRLLDNAWQALQPLLKQVQAPKH